MSSVNLASLLEAAAAGCVAGRLLTLGLARSQPFFFIFLLFTGLNYALLGLLPLQSREYFWTYVVLDVLGWGIGIAAVREMLALALVRSPRIRTTSQKLTLWAVGLSSAVSLAVTVVYWKAPGQITTNLFYFLVLDRSVVFALTVVIVSILVLLSFYPLHLRRSVYVSCGFFSAIFLSEALQQLIDSLAPHFYSTYVDVLQACFAALCLAGWAVALRREEAIPARVS